MSSTPSWPAARRRSSPTSRSAAPRRSAYGGISKRMSTVDPRRRFTIVGLLTWALVAGPPLFEGQLSKPLGLTWVVAVGAFLVCYLAATRPGHSRGATIVFGALHGVAPLGFVPAAGPGFE